MHCAPSARNSYPSGGTCARARRGRHVRNYCAFLRYVSLSPLIQDTSAGRKRMRRVFRLTYGNAVTVSAGGSLGNLPRWFAWGEELE
jgi:hypothetical protein